MSVDAILYLPQLPTTNVHRDNLLNALNTLVLANCILSTFASSGDATERAGDTRQPIRHARATRSEPIWDMQVRMMGWRIAQATSFSGRVNVNAPNVAIDPDRANSDRPIGWDNSNNVACRFLNRTTETWIWAHPRMAKRIPTHALKVIVDLFPSAPIVATRPTHTMCGGPRYNCHSNEFP